MHLILIILIILEIALVCIVFMRAHRLYSDFVKEHRQHMKLGFLAPVSLWLMDRYRLADRLTDAVSKVHQQMIGLHGAKNALIRTKCFIADALSLCIAIMIGSKAAAILADGNGELLVYGMMLTLFVPFVMYKDAANRLRQKKRQMLLELPEVLNQIVLLVNAGETAQKALLRCIENKPDITQSPLLAELAIAAHEIRMNGSFAKSMEDFNKRCGVQEVSLFTTTLLLNYKRGGDELVMSLKELSTALWDKRKSLAKTLGEEASSKMVFPMVIIFMVVMVIVAAPALMLMD